MRKFLSFIIYNIFILVLFLLIFSFYGKSIISTYVNSCIKEAYTGSEIVKEANNEKLFTSEEFNQIMADSETKELIDEFVDYSLQSIGGEEINFNTQDEIIEFLKDNKDILKEKYDIEITNQEIEQLKNNKEFNQLTNQYDQTIIKVRDNLEPKYKNLINIFNYICSDSFKIIAIIILIIDLLLYCLVTKSFIKWIKLIGVNLFICNISTVILGFITKNIFESYFNVIFDNSFMLNIGIIGIIVGIILIIVYYILDKLFIKKQEVKENNEVFEEYKEE